MNCRLLPILLTISAALLAGCHANDRTLRLGSRPAALQNITDEELRAIATNFADGYVIRMTQAFDELIASTTRPEIADWAVQQKIATATAAYTNATSPNPAVSCVDLVILSALKRRAVEEHWIPNLLGEEGRPILAAEQRAENEAWGVAARALNPQQIEDLRAFIEAWVQEHPDQFYVGWVRLTDLASARALPGKSMQIKLPTSLLGLLFIDPLAGLDPVAQELHSYRQLTERLTFLALRMPPIYGWQVQQAVHDITSTGPPYETIQAATRISVAAENLSTTAAQYPAAFEQALQKSLDRADTLFTHQRQAAVEHLSAEMTKQRESFLQGVDKSEEKIDATLTKTQQALVDAKEAAREISAVTHDAITHARNSIFWLIVAATVFPLLAMLAYRRCTTPRHPPIK